jgi:Domain of unknown function (DUF4304)
MSARSQTPDTPNARFTRVILSEMRAVLKPRGYRQRGQTFSLACHDVVQLVNLQKDKWSTREFLGVTVNLAVFSPSLHQKLYESGHHWQPTIERPRAWDGHWQERLGLLMPQQCDWWWNASNDGEARTAATGIADALARYGLPVLDQLSSTQKLRDYWVAGGDGIIGSVLIRNRYLRLLGVPDVPDEFTSRIQSDVEGSVAVAEFINALRDIHKELAGEGGLGFEVFRVSLDEGGTTERIDLTGEDND